MAGPKRPVLHVAVERARIERFVELGKHLRRDGTTETYRDMALLLRISETTLKRHIKAMPEIAEKLAAARVEKRGAHARRKSISAADF